jgi:uncharacterized protein (TIGR03435 family)
VHENAKEISQMIRATGIASLAVATACAAFGQSAASPLSFEVASIKPADGLTTRMRGDVGRLDYASVSLKLMIQRAYGVQSYQISGPDWIASTRFDVVAKLPIDTPRSKIPEMLQSLLAERFKLATHRETKESSMYALVVGKNGPKMKESEVDPNTPPGPGRGPMTMNLRGNLKAKNVNMALLANLLAQQLGLRVVDQTGLQGNYDFDLYYAPDDGQLMSPVGTPPPGGGVPGEVQVSSARDPDVNGMPLVNAVQSQLGLKLEAKKGPVDLVVVDHIEKAPTEN